MLTARVHGGRQRCGRQIGSRLKDVSPSGPRLTSLALLSVREEETFPLVSSTVSCADSALCEDDIDEAFVAPLGRRSPIVSPRGFQGAAAGFVRQPHRV
jgi:hypothetical protein